LASGSPARLGPVEGPELQGRQSDGSAAAADGVRSTVCCGGRRRRRSGVAAGGRVRRTGVEFCDPPGEDCAQEFGRRQPDDPHEREALAHRFGHRAQPPSTSGGSSARPRLRTTLS